MSEIEARVKGAEIPASIRRDERKTNVRLMEVGAEDERKAIIRIVRKYLLYNWSLRDLLDELQRR